MDLRLTTSPSTILSQSFFVRGDKVAMPKNKMALWYLATASKIENSTYNPVDVGLLVRMNSVVVIETVDGSRHSRNSIFLRQTLDCFNVRSSFRHRELSPAGL
jgi:hypothetical protein